jgi:hypothetical protein
MPPLADFEDLLDDEERTLQKKYFQNQNKDHIWNFKAELKKTSNYKTKILAKACLLFLKDSIDFQVKLLQDLECRTDLILHPFTSQVTTLPAYSYKMFTNFYLNEESVYAVMHENTSHMKTVSRGELELACFREKLYPERHYQHAFSSSEGQKKFGKYAVDLYSPENKTVTQYNGCEVHCHLPPDCCNPLRKDLTFETAFSIYKKSAATVDKEMTTFSKFLLENCKEEVKHLEFVYECNWKKFKKTKKWMEFQKSEEKKLNRPLARLIPRVAMRSGLLDIYKLRWLQSENPSETFKIADVNGLYAHIAMTKPFPVGKCQTIIGRDLSDVRVQDSQLFYKNVALESGCIHCTVLAPQTDLNPYLQYRISDKFNFLALCRMCATDSRTQCKHQTWKAKSFTSVWTIPDINKALQERYTILDIFEVQYFPERKFLLKNFVQCLSSCRLKNSGGLDDLQTEQEKLDYCKRHNSKMDLPSKFALTTENVINNPRQKLFYKDTANSLFGKFSQNSNFTKTEIVYSQHRLEELASKFEILEMYNLSETAVVVEYENNLTSPNLKANVFIGSEITAHARIIIHDHLKLLQSKGIQVYAVDTDCLFYSVPNNVQDPLVFSDCIGDYKYVVPKECQILSYHSLGCRNYSILYRDEKNSTLHTITKVKGLSLKSAHLCEPIDHKTYENYIEQHFQNEYQSMFIPQIRKIAVKPSCHKRSTLRSFEFKNDLFMKRYIDKNDCDFKTYPYGYKAD